MFHLSWFQETSGILTGKIFKPVLNERNGKQIVQSDSSRHKRSFVVSVSFHLGFFFT